MQRRLKNLLLILLLAPFFAVAQTVPEPVEFVISPEVPGPGASVRMEVRGVGNFVGEADIVWQKDGNVEKSGVGERTYTFTTGGLGSATRIRVVVDSASQGTIVREFVFRPTLVNLVWEADTSVPPLYKGRALYSGGSPLKVVAFPYVVINGSRVAAGSLSYEWLRKGEVVGEASGLGRSSFSFIGDELQSSEEVGVNVYAGSALVARSAVSIPNSTPAVVLYEHEALRGTLYDYSLPQGISLFAPEITLEAVPYFFSNLSKKSGAVSYTWTLGGTEVTGPDSARGLLTLRQTGEGAGSAGVEASAHNSDVFTQTASTLLQIVFGAQPSNSFFGL